MLRSRVVVTGKKCVLELVLMYEEVEVKLTHTIATGARIEIQNVRSQLPQKPIWGKLILFCDGRCDGLGKQQHETRKIAYFSDYFGVS